MVTEDINGLGKLLGFVGYLYPSSVSHSDGSLFVLGKREGLVGNLWKVEPTTPSPAPTDLQLSVSSVKEDLAAGNTVGVLTTMDPEPGDSFTYVLVPGSGSSDNSFFEIVGNQLKIKISPDFETKSRYQLRLRSTDASGRYVEKALTLNVVDSNEAPTDLSLTTAGVLENSAVGSVIGVFSASDPDAGSQFSYALVAGHGNNDADNARVEIVADQLRVRQGALIDYETNPTLEILVRVTDQGNPPLSFSKNLTISVLDVAVEPPPVVTEIMLQRLALTLNFSEAIAEPVSGFDGFTVLVGGQPRRISSIARNPATSHQIILNLAGRLAPRADQTLTVAYSQPAPGSAVQPLRNQAGTPLLGFAARPADRFLSTVSIGSPRKPLLSSYRAATLLDGVAANIVGNAADNQLVGNSASNKIYGGLGDDWIQAGAGNDFLYGDAGLDVLEGGAGPDCFFFNAKPLSFDAPNVDRVTDFRGGESDKLIFSKKAYGFSTKKVSLLSISDPSQLTAALSGSQLFVYDSSNGYLYWNQNGTAAMAGSAGIIAVLQADGDGVFPALIPAHLAIV